MKKVIINCITNEVTSEDLTPEEVTQREAETADNEVKQAELDAAEAQKATDKANAKAKLMAGEPLTEDEADTVVI